MTKNKEINIAFLGCGRVAQHYLNLLLEGQLKNINLVACCDLEEKKANEFSNLSKSKPYISFKKIRPKNINISIINKYC